MTYDISDDKRLRQVFKLMKGYGDHLQLSVFRCRLSPQLLLQLKSRLCDLIRHTEDQVLFIDIGPAKKTKKPIEYLGRPLIIPEDGTKIF